MTAPVAGYIQLPSDTVNSGKKNRTQTRAVGTDTVHEHFVVPSYQYTKTARYCYASTGSVVQASSQTGTGSGFFWLQMSTAATAVAMIRKIDVGWGVGSSAVAANISPLVSFQKFTYNTAFSGTTATNLKMQTTSSASALNIVTTSSGATITLGGPDLANFNVPALLTTVGSYGGQINLFHVTEEYQRGNCLELKAGEGLVMYQVGPGVTSDARIITARIVWDEIDVS